MNLKITTYEKIKNEAFFLKIFMQVDVTCQNFSVSGIKMKILRLHEMRHAVSACCLCIINNFEYSKWNDASYKALFRVLKALKKLNHSFNSLET